MTTSEKMSGSESPQMRATRALILRTAERHFKTYGYQKTTIVEIAKDCAMSHSNVYRFFADKAELVDAVAESILARMAKVGAEIVAEERPARERLDAFVAAMLGWKKREQLRSRRIYEFLAYATVNGSSSVTEHEKNVIGMISHILKSGNALGEFDDPHPDLTASFIHCAILKFCHPSLVEQYEQQDLEGQAHGVVALLLDGIPKATRRRAPARS